MVLVFSQKSLYLFTKLRDTNPEDSNFSDYQDELLVSHELMDPDFVPSNGVISQPGSNEHSGLEGLR
jgi:hypothetical protein